MPVVLDVAIGLIFVFLLVACVTSAVVEAFGALFDRRARNLEQAVRRMLTGAERGREPAALAEKAQKLLEHGLVTSLTGARVKWGKAPSYIPAHTFALALLDTLAPDHPTARFGAVQQAVQGLPDGQLRESLRAFVDDANGSLDTLRSHIEKWFDDTMERTSGVFKRYTQLWLFFAATLIAGVADVDTLHIGARLVSDEVVRVAVVESAKAYVAAHPPGNDRDSVSAKSPTELRESVTNLVVQLRGFGLPVARHWTGQWSAVRASWLSALIGWLLTGAAASCGAPFWFDALGKMINVRMSGQKPPAATRA